MDALEKYTEPRKLYKFYIDPFLTKIFSYKLNLKYLFLIIALVGWSYFLHTFKIQEIIKRFFSDDHFTKIYKHTDKYHAKYNSSNKLISNLIILLFQLMQS